MSKHPLGLWLTGEALTWAIAANDIDINYGKLALSKTKDKDVHAFAQQMVTDHSAVQKSVMDLGAKLHVTPADSPTTASLRSRRTIPWQS